MRPRTRLLVALALLLLAAGQAGAAVLHAAPCEDDCASTCGDCASCPPLASLAASPSVTPGTPRVVAVPTLDASSPSSLTRAIEHVPLGLPS